MLPEWYTRVVHSMTLAMTRPWKHPKTGMFWLRKRVPDDLRDILGKREEKRSLKTKNAAEAKLRLAHALAELETMWANLKRGPVALSEVQAHELAQPVYEQWINIHKENPSEQRVWNTEIGVAGVWEMPPSIYPAHLIVAYDNAPSLQRRCFETADELLAKAGLAVDEKSRRRLARAVSAAMHRASVVLQQMALGGQASGMAAADHLKPAQKAVPLKELLDGWAKEKRPVEKTLYSWEKVLDQLIAFVGHGDAQRLTADDLVRWKSALVESGLRAKTIRDGKLAPVRAILQWGTDNRRLNSNVAERIVIDVKAKPSERRRGYTDDEAVRLLRDARNQKAAHRRWIPWLCAFTGARVAEVCQLRAEDVREEEGIWCLHFSADAGSLKNVNSERIVPLHSVLIDQGFVGFAQKIKSGPLFPDLKPDRFGSRGGTGTKVFSKWVRELGIEDERISPNHSWRHRLKTMARRYGLATDIVDAIVGHRKRAIGDSYGEFPVAALKRELDKVPALVM